MIRSSNSKWRHDPDEFRRLADQLNTPRGVHETVDAILAEAAANPLTTWSEPFHGDLIPDVDYLSGVECDMRAEREAAV